MNEINKKEDDSLFYKLCYFLIIAAWLSIITIFVITKIAEIGAENGSIIEV